MIGTLPATHVCLAVCGAHTPGYDVWFCYRCDEWLGYTPCDCLNGQCRRAAATHQERLYPVLAPRLAAADTRSATPLSAERHDSGQEGGTAPCQA